MKAFQNKSKYSHLAEKGVELYKKGLSCREVACALEIKYGVVQRWVKNVGITRPSWLARQGKGNPKIRGEKHPMWKGGISFDPLYCWKKKLEIDHGMTIEEYNKFLQKQNGVCAICGKTETEHGRRLAVDHNHTTGIIRGLLCGNCNRGIGNLQENTTVLKNAITYLEKSNA